jgi:glycine cleavage system H lipoate-binding protein
MIAGNDNQIIPEGELHCVWMDAGLVDYKLCDREYQCEGCPFDAMISLRGVPQTAPPLSSQADRMIPTANKEGQDSSDIVAEHIIEKATGPLDKEGLPEDRLYHVNHSWVYNDRIESVTIGIDHIAAHLFKPIVGVVLPQPPTHVEQDAPCIWIVLREGTVTIRSPLSGTIIRANRLLRSAPSLINTDPYREGWILHIAPDNMAKSLDQLRSPARIAKQYTGDIARMRGTIREQLRQHYTSVGPTPGNMSMS